MYRVKAFTLMEVTIAMLISAVVIGITYTSYSIIVKYYGTYHKKNAELAELTTIDHLLRRDFDRADSIRCDTGGLAFSFNGQLIKYEFDTNFIIRKAARIDTFKLETKVTDLFFEGIPIIEGRVIADKKPVDELSFTLIYEKAEIPYHYHKLNSSENLLNNAPNAVN